LQVDALLTSFAEIIYLNIFNVFLFYQRKLKYQCVDITFAIFCRVREEADDLAKKLKLRFYRTSVKEDLNINDGKVKFPCVILLLNPLLKFCI